MRPFVFENPPLMDTPEGRVLGEYLSRQFRKLAESIQSIPQAVTWRGQWQDGFYEPYQMVTDDYWLAIPNKPTTERPAPQPIGDPFNVIELPGLPAYVEQSQSQPALFVGTRYTLSDGGYILEVRVNLPAGLAGFTLEVWYVQNPATTPGLSILVPEFTIQPGDTGGWKSIPVGRRVLPAGFEFDIVCIYRPVTGATDFTYTWDYKRKNGDPDSGEIWHQNGGNADQMRVNQNDDSDINRSTDLDNIGPGSRIEMLESGFQANWDVLDASKAGSVYTFIVEPASRSGETTSDFKFTYYATLPIPYQEALNHYTAYPNIRGFVETSYTGAPVLTANAYGIDIRVQEAKVSEDWDFLAYSG